MDPAKLNRARLWTAVKHPNPDIRAVYRDKIKEFVIQKFGLRAVYNRYNVHEGLVNFLNSIYNAYADDTIDLETAEDLAFIEPYIIVPLAFDYRGENFFERDGQGRAIVRLRQIKDLAENHDTFWWPEEFLARTDFDSEGEEVP